jgi:hypothetical protein
MWSVDSDAQLLFLPKVFLGCLPAHVSKEELNALQFASRVTTLARA